MYMPGRLRTASTPSRTVISLAPYDAEARFAPSSPRWEKPQVGDQIRLGEIFPAAGDNTGLLGPLSRASPDPRFAAGRPLRPPRRAAARGRPRGTSAGSARSVR